MSDTVKLTRDDLLYWIHRDLMRAYEDAKSRLDQDEYDVSGGLFTSVEVRAGRKDGSAIGKYKRIGHAINYREWETTS